MQNAGNNQINLNDLSREIMSLEIQIKNNTEIKEKQINELKNNMEIINSLPEEIQQVTKLLLEKEELTNEEFQHIENTLNNFGNSIQQQIEQCIQEINKIKNQ